MKFHQQLNQKLDYMQMTSRIIHTDEDHLALQEDLNAFIQWSHLWLMSFNSSKCVYLNISNRHHLLATKYYIGQQQIDQSPQATYIPWCNYRWKRIHYDTLYGQHACIHIYRILKYWYIELKIGFLSTTAFHKFHHWFSSKKSHFM